MNLTSLASAIDASRDAAANVHARCALIDGTDVGLTVSANQASGATARGEHAVSLGRMTARR
jgi:hypothetical protein